MPRVTIDEMAYHLQISLGSASKIIHNRLGFRKVCARSVPEKLTEENKHNRMTICQRLMDRCANEGEDF